MGASSRSNYLKLVISLRRKHADWHCCVGDASEPKSFAQFAEPALESHAFFRQLPRAYKHVCALRYQNASQQFLARAEAGL